MAFMADVRYAFRVLRKSPAFSLVSIAALALGIGANTAIFSVVNAVLLEPLPYPAPDQLVRLCRMYPVGMGCATSIPKYTAWNRAESFSAMTAYYTGVGLNLEGGERPIQVQGAHVTRDYFRVFGIPVERGRAFTAAEDAPGGTAVAVLTTRLWHRHFGSDPAIIGRTIAINGEVYTVVGLAKDDQTLMPVDLFIPLQADPNTTSHGHYLNVTARLKPGVNLQTAQAEMRVVGEQFRKAYPSWMSREEYAGVQPLKEAYTAEVRPALLILLGAVALVLLIACANVANLLLVRAAQRQREIAIRMAVGARGSDVVRQLLAESVLLSLIGAVAGIAIGTWGTQALLTLAADNLPRVEQLTRAGFFERVLDWRLLTFAIALATATGVLFGLAPAATLARSKPGASLKDGGRGATTASLTKIRSILVVGEIAAAMVLLVGAALLIRSFAGLRGVEPGFNPDNVLTLQTSLAAEKYSTGGALGLLSEKISDRLSAIPDVEATALAVALPTEASVDLTFVINGRPLNAGTSFHGSEAWRAISRDYFRVLQIPLVRGRLFNRGDTNPSAPVAIINEAMARKFWREGNPLGERITIGGGLGPEFQDRTRQIVGIVADVREYGLDRQLDPVIYLPAEQVPDATLQFASDLILWSWMVRTRTDPGPTSMAIQQAFLAAENLPTSRVRTMEQVVANSIASQNFNMLLLAIFGAVALTLATIGIYGLISYSVEQERRDIGVRLALGAGRRDILTMVVGRGARLMIIGLAIGGAIAFAATRLLRSMLYGVQPTDPATFVAVTLALGVTALLACYLPARRAARVDPLLALRSE